MGKSWKYGLRFFTKTIDAKDRLLIVLEESPFKRKTAQRLGQEFLDANSIQVSRASKIIHSKYAKMRLSFFFKKKVLIARSDPAPEMRPNHL
jgi:hypothetical protein